MHELSLSQAIVSSITQKAKEDNLSKIKSLTLEIGPLSGVVKDSMEFCFPIASKGTILEDTALNIVECPLKISCSKCNKEAVLEEIFLLCPHCQNQDIDVIQGKEFKIVQMEIE